MAPGHIQRIYSSETSICTGSHPVLLPSLVHTCKVCTQANEIQVFLSFNLQ